MRMALRAVVGATIFALSALSALSAFPAAAELALRFAEHPGEIVEGPVLKSEPLPDDGARCVDICREAAGCVATRLDNDQCLLYSSVTGERTDEEGLVTSWVGVRVDLSALRRDRMGELAFLHGDFLYRADSQWLALPVADGMAEDVLPDALTALDEGDFARAEHGLAVAFSLGRERSGVWRIGASRLNAALTASPPADRIAALGLREMAVGAATNAYLTALDEFERIAALDALGDALAGAGDFIAAAAVGRYRLTLKEDGAVEGSVETWEGEAGDAAPASEGAGPQTPEFGVWKISCDNAFSCVATAFSEGEHEGRLRIDYVRDAGPVGAPHIMVMAQPYEDDHSLGLPGESLFFDGPTPAEEVAATLEPLSWLKSPGLFTLVVPATKTADVIGLVAAADEALLRAAPGEPILGTLALAGFREAAGFIDGLQGRPGSQTALEEPGDRPAKSTPQPPKLYVVDAEPVDGTEIGENPPIAVADAWEAACDEHELVIEQGRLVGQGYRLDENRSVWLMPCTGGAYNFGSTAFLLENRKATQILFERPDGDLRTADDPEIWLPTVERSLDVVTMAEPEGDAAGGPRPFILRSYNRGRGPGDCGVNTRHVWEATGFRLYDQARMDWCKGWRDFWPMAWRSSAFPDRSDESESEAGAE